MDTPNKQSIGSDKTRDFLEKLIDEYKYGELSAEEICRKADDFFASHTVYCQRDEDLRRVGSRTVIICCISDALTRKK